MNIFEQVNYNYFFMNAAKIWAQNVKVEKLQICEIIYERNFENNLIVFFNDVLYFFHSINIYDY